MGFLDKVREKSAAAMQKASEARDRTESAAAEKEAVKHKKELDKLKTELSRLKEKESAADTRAEIDRIKKKISSTARAKEGVMKELDIYTTEAKERARHGLRKAILGNKIAYAKIPKRKK